MPTWGELFGYRLFFWSNYTHKRPLCGHCAPPLQKPSQSVCSSGLTSWGFMVNENDEPVHIHVCKGVPTPNATKIWIPPTGNPIVAHNHSSIPTKDLNRLLKGIAANKESIVYSWYQHFGRL